RDSTHGGFQPYIGTRESGYAYDFAVYLSVLSNLNINSRGLWSTRIATEFTNYWLPYQCGNGTSFTPAGCGVVTTTIAGTGALSQSVNPTVMVGTGTSFLTSLKTGIVRAVVTKGGTGYTSPPSVNASGCSGYSMTAAISGGAVTGVTVNTR